MMNQKVSTGLGVALIAILITTIGVFVWKCQEKVNMSVVKDGTLAQQGNTVSQTPTPTQSSDGSREAVQISDTWTVVSHENFWNDTSLFSKIGYKFPNIQFSYPSNWKFHCCGDTDQGSEHFIFSSQSQNTTLPYIRITNYTLRGCSGARQNCSLDKTVPITAIAKLNQLIASVPNSDVLPKLRLEKLGKMAFVYNKSEKNNVFSKGYLINVGDGVVGVDFVNYEALGDTFIDTFLSKLLLDSTK